MSVHNDLSRRKCNIENTKYDGPSLMGFTHFNEPGNFKAIESNLRPHLSVCTHSLISEAWDLGAA